jgi:hypothetical protein
MKRWNFAGFVLVSAVVGAVAVALPDIKRYLRIRDM